MLDYYFEKQPIVYSVCCHILLKFNALCIFLNKCLSLRIILFAFLNVCNLFLPYNDIRLMDFSVNSNILIALRIVFLRIKYYFLNRKDKIEVSRHVFFNQALNFSINAPTGTI